MVIVSTGDTNPHFGDFHFQNLTTITQLSIHRPLSAEEYLPKSIYMDEQDRQEDWRG